MDKNLLYSHFCVELGGIRENPDEFVLSPFSQNSLLNTERGEGSVEKEKEETENF
jgi:hypothetical protein